MVIHHDGSLLVSGARGHQSDLSHAEGPKKVIMENPCFTSFDFFFFCVPPPLVPTGLGYALNREIICRVEVWSLVEPGSMGMGSALACSLVCTCLLAVGMITLCLTCA